MHPILADKIISVLRGRIGLTVVAAIGVIVSLALFGTLRFSEHQRIREEVARRAAVRHAILRECLQGYTGALHGIQLLFENSADISHDEFVRAADRIREVYPGIHAVQWAPVVTQAQRDRFEADARADGIAPDFAIAERTPDGRIIPAATRPAYAPILFTQPLVGNRAALGYDLYVAPTAPDIVRARATGQITLTRRVSLIQSHDGLVVTCSVRRPGASNSDDNVIGFAQIVLRLDHLVQLIWESLPTDVLDVRATDITAPAQPPDHVFTRFAGREAILHEEPGQDDFNGPDVITEDLDIAGRTWRLQYRARAGWIAQQTSGTPYLALIGTLVLTLVTTSYLRTLQHQTSLIRHQVRDRTAELRRTQQLLEDDIHKREATEAELTENRRQLDSLLARMPGMVYRFPSAPDQPPLFVSQGSVEFMAYPPEDLMLGRISYLEHIHADDRARYTTQLAAAVEHRDSYQLEYRLHDRHGQTRMVLDRGEGVFGADNALLFVEGLVVDITALRHAEQEKLALERKLLEGQKFESLGILAGGIAHDFNNLLTGILGNASLARLEVPPASLPCQHLQHVEQAALRAAELCQQMLAYSGRGRFAIEQIDVGALVQDSLPLLTLSLSKQARLHLELDTQLPPVVADAAQVRQIVMNLVINASDALGARGGDITVRTGARRVTRALLAACVQEPDIPVGDYVVLEVQDNGSGMTSDTIAKIFDPFFTTKFAGRGLGLAAVLGIVRGHHGALQVESKVGHGSTFRIFLPPAPATASTVRAAPPASGGVWRHAARVLIVDDDPGVRDVSARLLTSFGMSPVPTSDGDEALSLFRISPDTYDLVLLDLTMPGLGGDEVLRRLRTIRADVPVLLMSGYTEHEALEHFSDIGGVSFVQKPFTIETLRAKLRALLETTPS